MLVMMPFNGPADERLNLAGATRRCPWSPRHGRMRIEEKPLLLVRDNDEVIE